ncbi:MAG: class F sortase, partial [Ilumatobacter sp.]|nr:class F sortase [Ilumatobacter sp.]
MHDSARSEPSSGRALLASAVVLGIGGVTLLGVAVLAPRDDGDTIEATPATAAITPVTVAPVAPAPTTAPLQVDASTVPPATTVPLSPLAELLGPAGSAIPEEVEPRLRPSSVTIDDLELWGPVRAVGLESDGQLEVPDETEIGWYRYGSSPGRPGATVLAAHVTWNRTIGPFFRLRELEPGATVDVRLEDGTQRIYEVVERAVYDKDELPRNRIWRTTGDETLVLITCGGSFNPDIRRYR